MFKSNGAVRRRIMATINKKIEETEAVYNDKIQVLKNDRIDEEQSAIGVINRKYDRLENELLDNCVKEVLKGIA